MLLKTKLSPPAHSPLLVERRRLTDCLEQWSQHRLTLITAPAGYGKTTLVSHWVRHAFGVPPAHPPYPRPGAQAGQPASAPSLLAWLSLDADDDTPVRFLRYLAAALHAVIPDVADAVDAMLASSGMIEPAATAILNAFAQPRVPTQALLFVLDDYQFIQNPAVHEIMQTLLDRSPEGLHWLIATRQAPPLRLSRHRLDLRLLEITLHDLYFTADESRRFFADALCELQLTEPEIAGLVERTGGWGAGMQLAALALRQGRGQSIADLPAVRQQKTQAIEQAYLQEYVVGELLGHVSPEWRLFVLETSVLEELSPTLCRAVTLQARSAQWLHTLAEMTALVMPISLEEQVYQCHAVLRETLQHQLQLTYSAQQVAELHRRAAGGYAAQGQIDTALRHLELAGDPAAQIRLVEDHCLPTLLKGNAQAVERWLSRLAQLPLPLSPRLALDAVWQCIVNERPGYAERLAVAEQTVAEALPPATTHHPWQQELQAQQASVSLLRGELAQAQRQAEATIATLDPSQSLALGACYLVLTHAGLIAGRLESMERAAEAAEAAFERIHCTVGIISAQRARAYGLFDSGAGMRAVQQYRRLLEFGKRSHLDHLREFAAVHLSFGITLYMLNQLDAAREQFKLAADLGRALSDPFWVILAELWLLICAHVEQPHLPPASPSPDLEDWEKRYTPRAGGPITPIDNLRIRWYLFIDAPGSAWEIIANSAFNPSSEPNPHLLTTLILYTHTYLACGKPAAQLAPAFERWAEMLNGAVHSRPLHLQFKICAARLALVQGNRKRALAHLDAVLEEIASTGYMRVVLDELAWLAPLLPACRAPLAQEFQRTAALLARPYTVLTDVELRVLNELGRALTNRAIAESLHISPNTVNFHLKRIFAKLGVNTRQDAVAKARSQGLI